MSSPSVHETPEGAASMDHGSVTERTAERVAVKNSGITFRGTRSTAKSSYARNFEIMLAGKDHTEEEMSKVMRVFVPKVVERMERATAAAKKNRRVRFGLLSLGGLLMCVSLLRDNSFIAVSPDASNVMFWFSIVAILLNTWLGHMATSMQLAEKATLYMVSMSVLKVMGTCFANRTAMYSYDKFESSAVAATQFWQDFAALELEVESEEVKILSGKGQIDGQLARLVAAMNEPSLLMRNQQGGVIVDGHHGAIRAVNMQSAARAAESSVLSGDVGRARYEHRVRPDTPRAKRARRSPAEFSDNSGFRFGATVNAHSEAATTSTDSAETAKAANAAARAALRPFEQSTVAAAKNAFHAASLDVRVAGDTARSMVEQKSAAVLTTVHHATTDALASAVTQVEGATVPLHIALDALRGTQRAADASRATDGPLLL